MWPVQPKHIGIMLLVMLPMLAAAVATEHHNAKVASGGLLPCSVRRVSLRLSSASR